MLSDIASTCRPRPEPTLRADHTVIGTSYHRASIGTISLASAGDRYHRRHWLPLGPRTSGIGATASSPRGTCEVALLHYCGRSGSVVGTTGHAPRMPIRI